MPARLPLLAGAAAVALLGGAWLLTVTSDDPAPPATTTSTTRPHRATTTIPDEPPTTPTTTPPPNTEWGGINLTDVTKAAGLDAPQAPAPPPEADGQTGGAAVADYDEDGDPDILLTRVGLPNRLLRNDGKGHFTDVAEEAGVAGTDTTDGYAAPVWADVNGDGHLDLYLTGAGRGASLLLVNDGTGHFTDQTAAAGLSGLAGDDLAGTASFGAAFDDWDHDGDLDLITLNWRVSLLGFQLATQGLDPNADHTDPCQLARDRLTMALPAQLPASRTRLYRNDGKGHFTDVTSSSGVDAQHLIGFQPVFADVTGDGWDDLLVTGDYCTSKLYRNDQGRGFTDITDQAGVGTDQNGMGSVVADLNGDGHLDWFVSAIAPRGQDACLELMACGTAGNRLYLGDGTGRFTDATDQFGVRDGGWGWGAAAVDLNLDGRLDLALTNGVTFTKVGSDVGPGLAAGLGYSDDASRVWINTGDGPWPEVAQKIGMRDRGDGKALVPFDLEGDGDLDLLVANTTAPPVLYRNDLPPGPDKHWLELRLRAPGTPNPYAIGARVTVDAGDGTAPRILTVEAGGSFQSSNPTDLHVGLGATDRVARIDVRWPDGRTQTVTDVAADQLLALSPPA